MPKGRDYNRRPDRAKPLAPSRPKIPPPTPTPRSPAAATPASDSDPTPTLTIPLPRLQTLINIFRDALDLSVLDADPALLLQTVKGHLFRREFAEAFGREDFLRVYAHRWSPSRAAGYLGVLVGLGEEVVVGGGGTGLRVCCFGGGAGGELVALAGWSGEGEGALEVTLLDVADWRKVLGDLERGITTVPELGKYAPLAKREANRALLAPEKLAVEFRLCDVLKLSGEEVAGLVAAEELVTFMFTLNELYTTSMPATQNLLAQLTVAMRAGAWLLVVDSPGSYSSVTINGNEKRYPMHWLLDLALLGKKDEKTGSGGLGAWEKVVEDQSRWWRVPKGLMYPIELENMRYQIHLYRRLGQGDMEKGEAD